MSRFERFAALSNRVRPRMVRVARRVPPLAVLHHRGRRSGRHYETPVRAYRTRGGTGYLVGLAYGAESDWVLNLLAAGEAELTRAGRRYRLVHPRRRGPDARAELPRHVAFAMRRMKIDDFVGFETTADGPGSG